MLSFDEKPQVQMTAVATIEAARNLQEAFEHTTIDLEQDTARVHAMFKAFEAGQLYRRNEEPALHALRMRLLGTLSDRVPGYRQIALASHTDDYYFLDEELEAIRQAWETLRSFVWLRQRVIDECDAERHVQSLRHSGRPR